mmetsp:Transcript_25639/g.56549  ORF Transcript_25639/g.56549 Transcript_25639/m.56549 type:complete len:524 (-) Transcript_25639:92-1663(-)
MASQNEVEGEEDEYEPPFMKAYFSEEMMKQYEPLAEAVQEVIATEGKDDEVWAEFQEYFNKYTNFECFSNWDGNRYDLVFYGVSGYTGYLMMEYLKRVSLKTNPENFTFAFAGRTVSKVKEMRDREFGGTEWADTPILQASFDDIPSIIDLVKSARVLINVAGPYMLTQGDIMIDACIQLGTHYIDISGEIPWSLRVQDLHKFALQKGVYVVPSAAAAGGFPDMSVFLCAKKLRDDFGEETRYAICYQSGGGAQQSASGGTLKTRAAMATAGDDVRKKMADPFALGGFIPDIDRNGVKNVSIAFGTGKVTPKVRQEDLDANLARITEDKRFGIWRGPFVYSYFDTRIVRRSNMLLADLGNRPYGRYLNFLEFAMLPPEAVAAHKSGAARSAANVEEEKKKLQEEGRYYKEGEGPPLEDLEDAWTAYYVWAQSEQGNEVRCNFIGRDGYFETCRVCIETAMCLRFDSTRLPFKGGVLTPTVACGTLLAKRLISSGMRFKMGGWFDFADCAPPPFVRPDAQTEPC